MSCFSQVLLAGLVLYCFTCQALLLTPGSCHNIIVLVAAVDERCFKLLVSGILQAYVGLARGRLRPGTAIVCYRQCSSAIRRCCSLSVLTTA